MLHAMGCRFTIYSLFMDIQNSFLDIQKSVEYWISKIRFLDIHKYTFLDIQKSVEYWISIIRFLDIHKSNYGYPIFTDFWISKNLFMDIQKSGCILGYP